ncbi:MAG: glycoside hydrolase family 57 protein, partial [Elusimicrobiota bacterium]
MKKLYLAFLWHHHQPVYRETISDIGGTDKFSKINYAMPWVRLHATKDYYDTAAIVEEFSNLKLNFNLVPSLLVQLDEYASGRAFDKQLELTLKPASELTDDDKVFILHNFFMANWENMVLIHPRYGELLKKRGRHVAFSELSRIQKYFKEQDFRDLQVWFNLAWFDPYWKKNDEVINSLFSKGKNFSEEDKQIVVNKQREICGKIKTKYKELQDKGKIEVSVTPFYHPILPLIFNTDIAKIAIPNINLPKRFSKPHDAEVQIQRAINYYENVFGKKPLGMWPSEGSVSEDIIPLIADTGIKWIATDEEILLKTITMQQPGRVYAPRRELLFQPYKIEKLSGDGKIYSINIIFRDRGLSDIIGFTYQKWDPVDAARDFLSKLHDIHRHFYASNPASSCFVPVILDGENCWEGYSNDGWDFLIELYKNICSDSIIETVTISDFLERQQPKTTIKHLFPGSWINANFGIWIGHYEDNLAWELLKGARETLDNFIGKYPDKQHSHEVLNAFEEIYISEGSDWCWWYGDDHTSGQDDIFDYLFRTHLSNVYKTLGEKIPDDLHIPIKGRFHKISISFPRDFIQPVIDGKMTDYFEWLPAAVYETGSKGGSMHQVETVISKFYYGFNLKNLFLRIDLNEVNNELEKYIFSILFLNPVNKVVYAKITSPSTVDCYIEQDNSKKSLISA